MENETFLEGAGQWLDRQEYEKILCLLYLMNPILDFVCEQKREQL